MRKTLIFVALVALAACGQADPTPGPGDTGSTVPPADAGPVYIEDTDLAVDGDTVTVTVRGNLPTPCDAPQTTIATSRAISEDEQAPPTRVDVEVWSERQTDDPCAQVLEPFEVSLSATFEEGGADVYVNGELEGSVD